MNLKAANSRQGGTYFFKAGTKEKTFMQLHCRKNGVYSIDLVLPRKIKPSKVQKNPQQR
jgi:hypothetical protein